MHQALLYGRMPAFYYRGAHGQPLNYAVNPPYAYAAPGWSGMGDVKVEVGQDTIKQAGRYLATAGGAAVALIGFRMLIGGEGLDVKNRATGLAIMAAGIGGAYYFATQG